MEAILEFKYLGKREKLNVKLQKHQAPIPVQVPVQNQTQAQKQTKSYIEVLQTDAQGQNKQDIRPKVQKTQQKQK